MRYHVLLLILILCLQTATAFQPKYRDDTSPDYVYNFTSSVFKNLPPMPDNLLDVANKYKYAQITARVLSEDYYLQPEFYPMWFETANKTYGVEPRMHGVAGYSIYPSTMDVYITDKTKNVTLYAILHASWGVEVYQGVVIKPIYNKSLFNVEVVEPERILLLPPTYPYFENGWAKRLVLNITIKKPLYHPEEILIKDDIPPEDVEKQWRQEYGLKYRSGGSILELQQPRLTIKIIPTAFPQDEPKPFPFWIVLILLIAIFVIYLILRKRRKKIK